MGLLRRKPKLPPAARPPLADDERVLAWAAVGKGPGGAGADSAGPDDGAGSDGGAGPDSGAGSGMVDGDRAGARAGAGVGDGVLVASNLGLWLPGREQRLGWHEILKAVWSGRELTVTPAERVAERVAERAGYLVVADGPAETYLLLDPGELPHQVRARVTRSVTYTRHHPVPGGAGRIAARRVSGVDGLTWTVRYDPGTPADDESVLAETDRLVAAARAATAPADL